MHDADGSGEVALDELIGQLGSLGVSDADVRRIFEQHGRTGRVDLDQFVQMMESTGVWTYQD